MRRRFAERLAVFLCLASLGAGAAGGPNSTESGSGVSAAKAGSSSKKTIEVQKSVSRGPKPFQVGKASWYGKYFDGKPTASGEPYDMHDFTAAHPTLPLGTYVKVTNLRNGRSVVVRVNDRGPVVEGRIIDVSYNAARALDFKARGVQRVRLDIAQTQTVAVARPVADLP
jgi:rare lipoprotein A